MFGWHKSLFSVGGRGLSIEGFKERDPKLYRSLVEEAKRKEFVKQETDEERRIRMNLEKLKHKAYLDAQRKERIVFRLYLCKKIAAQISQCINESEGWLNRAEIEYQNHCYEYFWNALEESALWFISLDNYFNQFEHELLILAFEDASPNDMNGEDSHLIVKSFSGAVEELVKRQQGLMRRGQSVFAFANIYQHRQTRKVLQAGFSSLIDAIDSVGSRLVNINQKIITTLERMTALAEKPTQPETWNTSYLRSLHLSRNT